MKILFATDRSSSSETAAWLLCHLPFREPLDVTVLTAVPVSDVVGTAGVPAEIQRLVHEERELIADRLKQAAAPFDGVDGQVQTKLADGNPAGCILDESEAMHADLIAMGARGHSPVERILLGSTSGHVATHAHCSVLVVRDTGLPKAPGRPLRVMVSVDGSEHDEKTIRLMKRMAWGPATELHVVRVMETLGVFSQDVIETSRPYWTQLKEEATAQLQSVQKSLHDVAPNGRIAVTEGPHVGEAIIDYANQHSIDLIVLGDRGHGMLRRLLLGSTSHYVLRHAHCSVAIAR